MASLLNATLPSDDEDDEDYDAKADKTCEAGDRLVDEPEGGTKHVRDEEVSSDEETETKRRKRAATDVLWQALKGPEAKSNVLTAPGFDGINMLCNHTTRTVSAAKDQDSASWMRSLGMTGIVKRPTPPADSAAAGPSTSASGGSDAASVAWRAMSNPATHSSRTAAQHASTAAQISSVLRRQTTHTLPGELSGRAGRGGAATEPPSAGRGATSDFGQEALAAAAAAIANAERAASVTTVKDFGKVVHTEKKIFAGKEIDVQTQLSQQEKDKLDAKKAMTSTKGLDAVLAGIHQKKTTVADKTAQDWEQFKDTNRLDEELDTYKKSDKNYLGRQSFLKDSELREHDLMIDRKLGRQA